MKKVWKTLGVIVLGIALTGCKNTQQEQNTIQERKVDIKKGIHVLSCTGVSKEKKTNILRDARITYDYDKNELENGFIKVTLKFQKKLTEEDQKNLKEFSFCSSDMMGELLNYGTCTTKMEEKEFISTLTLEKTKIPKSYSLEKMKKDLESIQNMQSTCKIK